MDDFEKAVAEMEAKREREYNKFMNTCRDKITSGDLIYRALALFIAKTFKVEIPSYGDIGGGVYTILNHYIEEVDEDFETWLTKDNGPMIRPIRDLKRIFKELDFIEDNRELAKKANELYNLEIEIDHTEEYMYALQFDFNSFTPIDVKKAYQLKEDKKILEKYGMPTDEVDKKLEELKIPQDIMEVI